MMNAGIAVSVDEVGNFVTGPNGQALSVSRRTCLVSNSVR